MIASNDIKPEPKMKQVTNSFDNKEQDNQWHFEQGRREARKALLALIKEVYDQPKIASAIDEEGYTVRIYWDDEVNGARVALKYLQEKIQNECTRIQAADERGA